MVPPLCCDARSCPVVTGAASQRERLDPRQTNFRPGASSTEGRIQVRGERGIHQDRTRRTGSTSMRAGTTGKGRRNRCSAGSAVPRGGSNTSSLAHAQGWCKDHLRRFLAGKSQMTTCSHLRIWQGAIPIGEESIKGCSLTSMRAAAARPWAAGQNPREK